MMNVSVSIHLAIITLLAYLLGSISFSFLVGKMHRHDLRTSGSGNLGAVNTARILGPLAGAIVLIFDIGKGFLAAWASARLTHAPIALFLASAAVMAGHNYSVFLRFTGGKGIAAAGGVLLFVSPQTVLAELLIAGVVFVVTRDIHDCALGMILLCGPLLGYFTHSWEYFFLGITLAFLSALRHPKDIHRWYRRIAQGETDAKA